MHIEFLSESLREGETLEDLSRGGIETSSELMNLDISIEGRELHCLAWKLLASRGL
jgi:hypothetical protein